MKHRVWGFTALRGPGSPLSSRQRSCEYFLLSDPYLCLKVLLYKPQHASCWIKTSSPAASVTAWLQNFMLLKKRGNLEQSEPLCPVPNHSELQQTQKGKGENLLRLVKRHGKTTQLVLFFSYRRTFFLSLFSHPMGSAECWERWEGGCKRRKEWGRDDKKARAHKSKQTNRIKPGLKAVRRQRTERQDYDRSSAAQRTAGWWSNTGAAGPPQHVHGGPGGQSERKKNWKKQKTTALPIRLVGAVIIQAVRRERKESKSNFRGPDWMSTQQRGHMVPTWPSPGPLSHRGPRRSVHMRLWKCKESKDNRELGKRRISLKEERKNAQMSAASVHYGWPKEPALAAHVHTMHTVAKRLSAAKSRACQRLNHSDLQQAILLPHLEEAESI